MPGAAAPADLAERTRRKVSRRILPFIFLLYIVAYLDRANVAFAKLSMLPDLGFSESEYGRGAGIFFLGYFLLEIPGALIVERWGARRWMARILITWGAVAALTGLIRKPLEFYGARFLLGLAEAGFFPGIIVYLNHWFVGRDRARALAGFITAVPVSMALGAPVSARILEVDWLGLAGWRWMFILEGLPAIVLGVLTYIYLPDRPQEAAWLEPEERRWLTGALLEEKERKRSRGRVSVLAALRQRNVLCLALALCLGNIGAYGFVFWLPSTIQKASELSDVRSTLYAGLPFAAGVASILLAGWSSDRTGERKLHTFFPLVLTGIFFFLSALPAQPFPLVLLWLCLAACAIYAFPPPFWVLPTLTLGESAAAASIGLINSIGNLGGFLGPTVVGELLDRSGSRLAAVSFLSASFLAAAGLILLVRGGGPARGAPVSTPEEAARPPASGS